MRDVWNRQHEVTDDPGRGHLTMPEDDSEERELRISLMKADLQNKAVDTDYKKGLMLWEPWKVLALGLGAGAGLLAASVSILGVVMHLLGK